MRAGAGLAGHGVGTCRPPRSTLGDFETGWAGFEARLAENGATPPRWYDSGAPTWNGTDDLKGKKDPAVRRAGLWRHDPVSYASPRRWPGAGQRLSCWCSRSWCRCWAAMPGGDRLPRVSAAAVPQIDLQFPLMSLPARPRRVRWTAFRRTAPIWRRTGKAASAWAGRLATLPGLKVGLVWAGDPQVASARFRPAWMRGVRCASAQLAPLAAVKGGVIRVPAKGGARPNRPVPGCRT